MDLIIVLILVTVLVLVIVFMYNYLRQERINKLLLTFFLRSTNKEELKDIIEHLYINDAIEIKKFLKRHFNNVIDVDDNDIFKDIKRQ